MSVNVGGPHLATELHNVRSCACFIMRKLHILMASLSLAGLGGGLHCGSTNSSEFAGACATDDSCPSGHYCASGRCAADCVADQYCPSGAMCSPRGRCND